MPSVNRDRMPDLAFRMMSTVMVIKDALFPSIDRRVSHFGIREGMTVVDYGCGPGRYTIRFSQHVGKSGIVYAVDVHELAIQAVETKMKALDLTNIIPMVARDYVTAIPEHSADMLFALDMFFMVKDPARLLQEFWRILRPDGLLILDDGHQSRKTTLDKVDRVGGWQLVSASRDHLRYRRDAPPSPGK